MIRNGELIDFRVCLSNSDPPVCVSINSAMVRQKLALENFEFYASLVSGMIDGFDGYLYDDGNECDLFACIDKLSCTRPLGGNQHHDKWKMKG